jgi:hypothetical protein
MPTRVQFQSGCIDLNQRAKALTLVHPGTRNLLRKQRVDVVAATATPSD